MLCSANKMLEASIELLVAMERDVFSALHQFKI